MAACVCVCVSHLSLYQCQGLLSFRYQPLQSGRIADCPVGPEGIANPPHRIGPETHTQEVSQQESNPEPTSSEKMQKRAIV